MRKWQNITRVPCLNGWEDDNLQHKQDNGRSAKGGCDQFLPTFGILWQGPRVSKSISLQYSAGHSLDAQEILVESKLIKGSIYISNGGKKGRIGRLEQNQ